MDLTRPWGTNLCVCFKAFHSGYTANKAVNGLWLYHSGIYPWQPLWNENKGSMLSHLFWVKGS